MIRAWIYLAFTMMLGTVLATLIVIGDLRARDFQRHEVPPLARLADRFGLTDLALWTEARYTRHPSQADRFAAFQDAPAAFDLFPAGSIVAPPPDLTQTR